MKDRKFSELRDALYEQSPDSRDRVAGKVAQLNEQLALADLRARRSRTQAQLAEAIGTTQSAVSRLERQQDLLVSTLRDYVEATGGHLRLVAEYPDYELDIDLPVLRRSDEDSAERAFRVVWQNLQTRQFVHVGWLRSSTSLFTFGYTPDAELDQDFEPFAPFPDLRETYSSAVLFPFFADRVASAAQPGFDDVITALGLKRAEATPVELLARSWGRSSHDTIQIVPEPVEHPDGTQTRLFLVSGVSHVDEDNPGRVTKVISKLKPGRRLSLREEPENPFNSHALVIEVDGDQVGWMPDYLLDEVHKAQAGTAIVDVAVEQANGPEAPWHLRLLCRLEVRSR
ncbi:MAG: uncharacterized protein JWN67_1142 [Actinomycetia bacterium]|nr:uncharacterized protein [Actinomycetes bacterium]